MKILNPLFIAALTLAGLRAGNTLAQTATTVTKEADSTVRMIIRGGHETDPRDHGRPVSLIAGALQVPPEIFREAFTRVKPAPAGESPNPDQVRRNKQNLLEALLPYGVTNDRLDEVSDFYRYSGRDSQLWRHRPAIIQAILRHGQITGFTIIDHGAGYTSAPMISVPGLPEVHIAAILSLNSDLASNGSITNIIIETNSAPTPD